MPDHPRPALPDILRAFLTLGLTSFGGPIAHLAYFHREFVEQRRWLSEAQYAQLLALCQFLPGPASSQLGFCIGLLRGGVAGALIAFLAFTLPSAVLMFAFAKALPMLSGDTGQVLIHGLKLVAVAVVAHGVIGMSRQLCPDWPRRLIALLTLLLMLSSSLAVMQWLVVLLGALLGTRFCRDATLPTDAPPSVAYGTRTAVLLLALFALLLLLTFWPQGNLTFMSAAAFYQAGALVFGGGHVVLPLLQQSVVEPGWITSSDFLAGYGAAQAVPGPMFTLAAYLGASLPGAAGGALGASLAVLMIFLPGFLLIAGALPLWQRLTRHPSAASVMAGVNAAVVGLLAAALYNPVWTSSISGAPDIFIAGVGLLLLRRWRVSALWVVLWCVSSSVVLNGW